MISRLVRQCSLAQGHPSNTAIPYPALHGWDEKLGLCFIVFTQLRTHSCVEFGRQ